MTISKIETIVPFKLLTSKHTQKGSKSSLFSYPHFPNPLFFSTKRNIETSPQNIDILINFYYICIELCNDSGTNR